MTYSLVARDPYTGELGVAAQSHFFCVGPAVCWAEPGVGAVATQAFVEAAYGPGGLEGMGAGDAAPAALHRLLADDPEEAVRQVAMVDAHGRVAVHTGARTIAHAGHAVGSAVSVQANMMRSPGVPEAMLGAWRQGVEAKLPLAERMIACLAAAEAAGGDVRGRQSAALVVVAAAPTGDPVTERPVDLRVDDDDDPVAKLRCLLIARRAYDHQERGEEAAAAGDFHTALAEFAAAGRLAPDNVELAFWRGVALTSLGRERDALPFLECAFAEHDGWRNLYERLPDAGLLPADARNAPDCPP